MSESEAPALKELFNADRFRSFARELSAVKRGFDTKRFLAIGLRDLDELSLLQRLRRMTDALRATLPEDYRKALRILRELAPRIQSGFVTLVLPDFVGQHGRDDFDASLEALEFFTSFGSSEFAVREFLRLDLHRTLKVMERWSRNENEHVRRLASEGCRPRLPWSFRLDALIADPSPVVPILENLKEDPSLYVRKSVANHLNDISKDHPAWLMDRLDAWPREVKHTAWIAKRALRTLIKAGDRRALLLIGATEGADVRVREYSVAPRRLVLGERLNMTLRLQSTGALSQRLVVDYVIHYVKKGGGTSRKVFKWKELTLAPGETASLSTSQVIRNFTTRVHYTGRHRVELLVNGQSLAEQAFNLVCK